MGDIARDGGNRININRRGHALATRETDNGMLVQQLYDGVGDRAGDLLRYHEGTQSTSYHSFDTPDWEGVPDGVDILRNLTLIWDRLPSYGHDIQSVIHIRRGGDITGKQPGANMLDYLQEQGAKRVFGEVEAISRATDFSSVNNTTTLLGDELVNAAGPCAARVAAIAGYRAAGL